jgi:photosystem I subunit XI
MVTSKFEKSNTSFDVISPFEGDPFVGHLSTPITRSQLTKTYLSLLPAYKTGLSPLLRGINIGFSHAYFLLGPFVQLGPLRNTEVAGFIGFIATISLIIILTVALTIYGLVSFSNTKNENSAIDFLTKKGWKEFTSGFIIGGFGGLSLAYILLNFFKN